MSGRKATREELIKAGAAQEILDAASKSNERLKDMK